MLPIAYYLLKVIVCSGILYGYYWLLLRNKVFHGYNRFYLMAAVVLSLLLPLIKINFWQQPEQQQAGMIQILQAVSSSDAYMDNVIIRANTGLSSFDWEQVYPLLFLAVSLVMAIIFIRTLYFIRTLLKQYPQQQIGSISFVNTDAKSTPFSFLHYIFWNQNIDMDTSTGKQIFKHEVAHVQEKHTYDKLFINLVLIFYWSNPFFWLIRKELNMIHEFIADKKAVEDSDTTAFAAMILQATYPQHRFQLTNNFFYSPIKRRLLMLTKNNNPRVNYWGRIMVLPLAVLVFAAFTFKVKSADKTINDQNTALVKAQLQQLNSAVQLNDTTVRGFYINTKFSDSSYLKSQDFKTRALIIIDDKEIGNFGMDYIEQNKISFTTIITYKPSEAKKIYGEKGKSGAIVLTQKSVTFIRADTIYLDDRTNTVKITKTNSGEKAEFDDALIYLEGKVITSQELKNINPEKINSIDILKGDKLPDIMESQGKKSVINISLKPDNLKEVVVVGKKATPLYVIDGKEQDNDFNLNSIDPENIQRVDVLKDNTATEKYGEKGKHGVVLITTKKENPVVIAMGKPATVNIKMEELYIGILNPVTVQSNVDVQDLVVSVSNGSVSGNNGRYMVSVVKTGLVTIIVSKSGNGEILGSFKFNAVRVPDNIKDMNELKAAKLLKVADKTVSSIDNAILVMNGAVVTTVKTYLQNQAAYPLPEGDYISSKFLASADAIKKYGKQGEFGALEITVDEKKGSDVVVVQGHPSEKQQVAAVKKEPVISVGNLSASCTVNADDFKSQKEITVSNGYSFVSANAYFGGKGFPTPVVVSINGSSMYLLKEQLEKCQSGSFVSFDNVRVKKDGVGTIAIDGKSYALTGDITVVGYPSPGRTATDNKVFIKTEIEPSFVGGSDVWKQYLQKNLDANLPALDGWKPGTYTIIVQFIVHTDGSVSDVTSINYQGSKTAQHCIDLIRKSPKWAPAIQNNRKVNAYRKQPITFVVEENTNKAITEIYNVPLKVHLMNGNSISTYHMVGNGAFTMQPGELLLINGKPAAKTPFVKREDVLAMEFYDAGAGKKIFGEKVSAGVLLIKTKS